MLQMKIREVEHTNLLLRVGMLDSVRKYVAIFNDRRVISKAEGSMRHWRPRSSRSTRIGCVDINTLSPTRTYYVQHTPAVN
jgi:hypothetical protein